MVDIMTNTIITILFTIIFESYQLSI